MGIGKSSQIFCVNERLVNLAGADGIKKLIVFGHYD
jgi:hypothetical protein